MNQNYLDTVRLLIDIAPEVFRGGKFALKGGTAINLFVEPMPRLSVDLDLVFLPLELGRSEALAEIEARLGDIRSRLTADGLQVESGRSAQGDETKLFVSRGTIRVKVEVNHVFRGTLLAVRHRTIEAEARRVFASDLSLPILDPSELYGSKLVAALDRQHPRDWFDVLKLLERGKLTGGVVDCFVGYLAGHNRPVHEVLFSRDQEMTVVFEREFLGMTREPVDVARLIDVRRQLRGEMAAALGEHHRKFLISLDRTNSNLCGRARRNRSIKNLSKLVRVGSRTRPLNTAALGGGEIHSSVWVVKSQNYRRPGNQISTGSCEGEDFYPMPM